MPQTYKIRDRRTGNMIDSYYTQAEADAFWDNLAASTLQRWQQEQQQYAVEETAGALTGSIPRPVTAQATPRPVRGYRRPRRRGLWEQTHE